MKEELSRLARIAGEEAILNLTESKVAVFGLGGVGSAALEALARSGVGSFLLVDNDRVARSNLNRQIIALQTNLGQLKTQAAKERILAINPQAKIETSECFYLPGSDAPSLEDCDFVIDAIDTVSGKIRLIEECRFLGIPLISSMGTGNKFDPSRLRITELEKTSVCPLCRVMRKEMKERGIRGVTVLFSDEEPAKPADNSRTPGSFMPVTACAGLMIAGYVLKKLMEKDA